VIFAIGVPLFFNSHSFLAVTRKRGPKNMQKRLDFVLRKYKMQIPRKRGLKDMQKRRYHFVLRNKIKFQRKRSLKDIQKRLGFVLRKYNL
jgi:hypothetical protein